MGKLKGVPLGEPKGVPLENKGRKLKENLRKTIVFYDDPKSSIWSATVPATRLPKGPIRGKGRKALQGLIRLLRTL